MDVIHDNLYLERSLYSVYAISDNSCYLSIPKAKHDTYDLYVGFPQIDLDSANDEDREREIKRISDILNKINNHAVYLLCNVPKEEIADFASYNDNKVGLYKLLHERIYKYLEEAYGFLDRQQFKIKLPVNMIKQNDDDTKLINWLETDDSKLIKGIKFKKIKDIYNEMIFSGTMVLPFINAPVKDKPKVKVRKRNTDGYTKVYLIITIIVSLIIGIGFANLLIK